MDFFFKRCNFLLTSSIMIDYSKLKGFLTHSKTFIKVISSLLSVFSLLFYAQVFFCQKKKSKKFFFKLSTCWSYELSPLDLVRIILINIKTIFLHTIPFSFLSNLCAMSDWFIVGEKIKTFEEMAKAWKTLLTCIPLDVVTSAVFQSKLRNFSN